MPPSRQEKGRPSFFLSRGGEVRVAGAERVPALSFQKFAHCAPEPGGAGKELLEMPLIS
jgi:hypothetical protein